MKTQLQNILTYCITIIVNLSVGFLFTGLFQENDYTNFIMFTCGFILLSTLVVYFISKKLNISLDILKYEFKNLKESLLNNIFVGNLFSIPISMFLSILL